VGDQWLSEGVLFTGPAFNQEGAIVEQPCFDRVSGHSPPNIVGYVPGLASTPLGIEFTDPVAWVSILATNWNRVDTITLTAFDAGGSVLGMDEISTLGQVGPLQELRVEAPLIARAELTSLTDEIAVDDVRFLPDVVNPPEFVLYESESPIGLVDPANAVASAPGSPIEHAPPPAALLFYAVDDGTGTPEVITLTRGGPGLVVEF
jgi:hypothetical protein